MLSDQFLNDYRKMTAEGVKFTPADIVRLNALMLRVRLSQDAANTVALPRLAFIGKLVLREPTLAHELWIEQASRWIDPKRGNNHLWLYGYALSRPARKLPDTANAKRLVNKVYAFAEKRLASFTREQLSTAITYALVGNDWSAGETSNLQPSTSNLQPSTSNLQPQTSTSPSIGLLLDAKALRLPISLDEAMRMTTSELSESIFRCVVFDKNHDFETARHRALGEYVRAREEIRNRK